MQLLQKYVSETTVYVGKYLLYQVLIHLPNYLIFMLIYSSIQQYYITRYIQSQLMLYDNNHLSLNLVTFYEFQLGLHPFETQLRLYKGLFSLQ